MFEEDPEVENMIKPKKLIARSKPQVSPLEASKQNRVSSPSSSSSSSYLTLKSHLLLMNTPTTSKSNKYKRSHSSISNPETKQKEQEEEEVVRPEKASKSAPVQGK